MNVPGDYEGFSSQLQRRRLLAACASASTGSTQADFDVWVAKARGDGEPMLDRARYLELAAAERERGADAASATSSRTSSAASSTAASRRAGSASTRWSALDARGGTGLAGTLNTMPGRRAGRRAPSATRRSTSPSSAPPPSRSRSTAQDTVVLLAPPPRPRAGRRNPLTAGATPMATETLAHAVETSFLFGRLTWAAHAAARADPRRDLRRRRASAASRSSRR